MTEDPTPFDGTSMNHGAPRLRRMALRLGVVVASVMVAMWLAALWAATWRIGGQPVSSIGDVIAQAELFMAPTALTLTTVLAVTTIYYAYQTRQMVLEMRASREAEAAARTQAERLANYHRMRGAASALMGASSDLLATGTLLAELLRARRVFRVRVMEPSTQAIVAGTRAIDELRYLAPAEVTAAADSLLDTMVNFYGACTRGARAHELRGIAGTMGQEKQALQGLLSTPATGAGTGIPIPPAT